MFNDNEVKEILYKIRETEVRGVRRGQQYEKGDKYK